MKERLTHLYFGNGKGKTTASMGLALRALGNGWRVVVVQFLKSHPSGEVAGLEKLGATVIRSTETMKFVFKMTEEEKQAARAVQQKMLNEAIRLVNEDQVDLLVLDEAGSLCQLDMLEDMDVLRQLVEQKPAGLELVITAHEPAQWLLDAADYCTEMRCHRHPFDRGIPGRKGVEF